MKLGCATLIGAIALGACSTSRVTPVSATALQQAPQEAAQQGTAAAPARKRICVIENPRVNPEFLEAYRTALADRGYDVRVFKKTPSSADCPITSRYTANWAWDMVLYMSYAELRIYRDGKPAGKAEFRARGSRLIDTDSTVKGLVDRLLPK